jgi:hypothetical protein
VLALGLIDGGVEAERKEKLSILKAARYKERENVNSHFYLIRRGLDLKVV